MSRVSRPETGPTWPAVFLQIAALSAFAIGQPLLQLIRQNPEFLVVHDCRAVDLIVLLLVLFVLPPLLLSGVVYLTGLGGARFRLWIHAAILGGLFVLVTLPLVDRLPAVGGWATLAVVAVLALGLGILYVRSRLLQQNLTYLALAVPAFLVLFLGSQPVRHILVAEQTPPVLATSAGADDTPVIMIVLDELPTSTLMTADLELDQELFPNFARLADCSTWYRNATSVSPATLRSVPCIMSGVFPTWDETPTVDEHPRNIFTLLGASHQVISGETLTHLCPEDLLSEPIPRLQQRLALLLEDTTILYQHIVVPGAWRGRLIRVSEHWGGFRESAAYQGHGDKPKTKIDEFEDFVASLQKGEKPFLAVGHFLLPHIPFRFLPSGQVYNWRKGAPTRDDLTWGPDELVMAHSYRRHIINVVTTDRLIGDLLDRLEALDLLRETAIVLTADHGVNHRVGQPRRRFSDESAGDIMPVPLFIKQPGQTTGVVDDRYAQTVDIMPTLTAALGVDPGWSFDGRNLNDNAFDRTELDFLDQDTHEHRKISTDVMRQRLATIQWKQSLFGTHGGLERLFTMGDAGGLRGQDILKFRDSSDFRSANHADLRGRILEEPRLKNVDLSAHFIPAEINGIVQNHTGNGRLNLALALNGRIAGVSQTYLAGPEPGTVNWQITVDPTDLRNGNNEARLFLVTDPTRREGLVPIPLFTPSFLAVDLGGRHVAGIEEEGLIDSEDWDGRWVRWTKGRGVWKIPLKAGERPTTLTVGLVSSGPPGGQLRVTVNGSRLLDQHLPQGDWETRLPLYGVEFTDRLIVVLESRIWVPAEHSPESTDRRELGVAVRTLVVK